MYVDSGVTPQIQSQHFHGRDKICSSLSAKQHTSINSSVKASRGVCGHFTNVLQARIKVHGWSQMCKIRWGLVDIKIHSSPGRKLWGLRILPSVPGAYLLHMLISMVVCIVNANFIYMHLHYQQAMNSLMGHLYHVILLW